MTRKPCEDSENNQVSSDADDPERFRSSTHSCKNDHVGLDFTTVLSVHFVALRLRDDVVGDEFHILRVEGLVVTTVEHSSLLAFKVDDQLCRMNAGIGGRKYLSSNVEIGLEDLPVLLGGSFFDAEDTGPTHQYP